MTVIDELDLDEIAEARRTEECAAVCAVLSSYQGRAFVWMLLQEAGSQGSSFCGEMPLTMALKDGRRELCTWAENWVFTAKSEAYSMMRQEAIKREQRYAHEMGLASETEEE